MATLADYKNMVKKATTQEELHKISYEAFLKENNKLDNQVVELCVKREVELGLLKIE